MVALSRKYFLFEIFRSVKLYPRLYYCTQAEYVTKDITEDEFRVLELYPPKKVEKPRTKRRDLRSLQPREHRMPITQDWKSVWPTARSFQPSSVPLPIFQGYKKKGAPPYKYANAELMKVPNFLHLTPPAIEAHCAVLKLSTQLIVPKENGNSFYPRQKSTMSVKAIKGFMDEPYLRFLSLRISMVTIFLSEPSCELLQTLIRPLLHIREFCTKWPEGLDTDKDCDKHFPIEVITSDYCHSSPTIRDERARIVTVKIKLSSLNLDYHARDKFLRLVGDRYDKASDIVTIVADRCPMRKQNYDYIMYVLTALYHESWKVEPWESEKTEADMEKFFFEGSRNEAVAVKIVKQVTEAAGQQECSEDDIKKSAEIQNYGNVLCSILNEEESSENIQKYKENVSKLLGLETYNSVA